MAVMVGGPLYIIYIVEETSEHKVGLENNSVHPAHKREEMSHI